MKRPVTILDSTLREGEQTPGVYFAPHVKLAIADLLDRMGVDIIETGHPAVSESIYGSVRDIAARGLNATVGAHSRSLKRDVDLGLECGVGFLGIFYCVSDQRLRGVFRSSIAESIDKIAEVIAYARSIRPSLMIRYTPEDTVRSEYDNVVQAAGAAIEAGADIISIADTTGYMVPHQRSMYDYVSRLKDDLTSRGLRHRIAVHCHNDRGLALPNALDAFRAGADIIDASVLGLGERAGIVDLAQLLTVLANDFDVEKAWDLKHVCGLYKLVSKHARVSIPVTAPLVGGNAFTHCAGVHTHAALEDPCHYESISPETYGRTRAYSLDHMSGLASVQFALEQIGVEPDADFAKDVLRHVKAVGETGRVVDLSELRQIVDWSRHSDRECHSTPSNV